MEIAFRYNTNESSLLIFLGLLALGTGNDHSNISNSVVVINTTVGIVRSATEKDQTELCRVDTVCRNFAWPLSISLTT